MCNKEISNLLHIYGTVIFEIYLPVAYLGQDTSIVGGPGAVPQQHSVGQGTEWLESLSFSLS
jgi:hypothetical protein